MIAAFHDRGRIATHGINQLLCGVNMRFLRFVRKLLKVSFLLLLIPLVPALIWVICNQIDRAPSAYSKTLEAPYTQTLPDARNAWLYMLGIGAEPGADPIEFGRKRVDTYLAQIAANDPPDNTDAFADSNVPLAFKRPEKGSEIHGDLCRYRYADCVELSLQNADYVRWLVKENTELLSRYETLLSMMESEDTPFLRSNDSSKPSVDATIVFSTLRSNRIALDVADGGDPVKAAAELASDIAFWQQQGSISRDPGLRFFAFDAMERNRRVLDAVTARSSSAQQMAMSESFAQALKPMSASLIDARPIIRYKYQEFRDTTLTAVPGFWASLGGCLKAGSDSCVKNIGIALSFAPQASANQLAEQYREAEALLDLDPLNYEAASSHYGSAMEERMWLGDARKSLYFLLYNPAGKTLAFIAMPRIDLSMIAWDEEALRRMLILNNSARHSDVGLDRMTEWLTAQPTDLQNPWDGKPFAWNPVSREIFFAPKAKHFWNADEVHVGLESQKDRLLQRCEHPMQITIEPVSRKFEPGTHFRTITCFSPQPTQAFTESAYYDEVTGDFKDDPGENAEDDSTALFERYRGLAVHSDQGRIDIRVLQKVGGQWLAYQQLGIDPKASPEVSMTPNGDANGPALKASLVPPPEGKKFIGMYLRSQPSNRVLDELIHMTGIRVDNRELATSAEFGISAEALRVSTAIEFIADVSGLDVREVGKNHYAFSKAK